MFQVKTIHYSKGKTEVNFAAYRGQGVMYRVLVRQDGEYISSYVPAVSFSCDNQDGECNMQTTGLCCKLVIKCHFLINSSRKRMCVDYSIAHVLQLFY